MSDIVAFLRARLNDDERIARAAGECNRSDYREFGVWTFDDGIVAEEFDAPHGSGKHVRFVSHSTVRGMLNHLDHSGNPHLYNPEMEHIASHDPARTLRGIVAKRRIIDLYLERKAVIEADVAFGAYPDDSSCGQERGFMLALFSLAEEYADHPEFNGRWRALVDEQLEPDDD